ncbi:hypothetical protein ACMFMG_004272 [Clarireedia jacksonii]
MSRRPGQSVTPVMARKFGRQFQHQSVSLNYHKLGKVNIDCKFRQSKTRWGIYGKDQWPTGIIYIDLIFDQPNDCRLSSATVLVTLEEDHSNTSENDDRLTKTDTASNLVQIIDRYGPKHLRGPEKVTNVKKTLKGTPNVNILGNGAGGLGMDIEKTCTYASRWTFNGTLVPELPGKGKRQKDTRGMVYKSVKWELSENDIATQSVHSNVIHTGFAFQHEGKPCYLRVEIDGKLQRTRDRFKQKLLKFPPALQKHQGSILTTIDPGQSKKCTERFDAVVDGLEKAMEYENYTEIPPTVPDTLPAIFHEEQHPNVNTSNGQSIITQTTTQTNFLQGARTFNQNKPQRRINQSQPQPYIDALTTVSDPLLESLARAIDPIPRPDFQQRIHEYAPSTANSEQSGQTTLVGQQSAPLEDAAEVSSKEIQMHKNEGEAAEEVFRRLAQNPAFLIFIRFFVSFLDLFGRNLGDGKAVEKER